jgi:hypothetical protein
MDEEKIHPCHLLPHQPLQQKVPETEEDTLLQNAFGFLKSFTVSVQKVDSAGVSNKTCLRSNYRLPVPVGKAVSETTNR